MICDKCENNHFIVVGDICTCKNCGNKVKLDKDVILQKDHGDWSIIELDFMKKQDDCCDECSTYLSDDDYFGDYEDRGEYWGQPCSEYVVQGYICPTCGHKENF